jgi:SSS family solute:Na+ symporter
VSKYSGSVVEFFAGGMRIILLGMISRIAGNTVAKLATTIGILIVWMTFSGLLPDRYTGLQNPFNFR